MKVRPVVYPDKATYIGITVLMFTMSYTMDFHHGAGVIFWNGLNLSIVQNIAAYFAPFFQGQKLQPGFGRFQLIM